MASIQNSINLPYPSAAAGQMAINSNSGTLTISNGSSWVNIEGVSHYHEDHYRKVDDRLEKIENMLCILTPPSKEVLEKYESLKRAYEEYKFLEKLILGGTEEK